MATSDTSDWLGSWSGGTFDATVSEARGTGVDCDVPDDLRFMAGVATVLRRRIAAVDSADDPDPVDIAIFVLNAPMEDIGTEAVRVPMFDNGQTIVTGRLWLTTPSVVSAWCLDLPNGTDNDRFQYVAEELRLGTQPTIIWDSRSVVRSFRWYPNGLAEPEHVELKPLAGEIDPHIVYAKIDHLSRECFMTPTGMPTGTSLWKNGSKYWPHETAESLIQSHLRMGLIGSFPYCTIRHEQTQTAGRTDLEIEQCAPGDRSIVTYHCVLELKVLRSYRATGTAVPPQETRTWIEEGVKQAAHYRQHKGARWSALCCFDMRDSYETDSKCFGHVNDEAADLAVELWRWKLFGRARDYRHATTLSAEQTP